MLTTYGVRGSFRRALRAGRFGAAALVVIVTVGLCTSLSTAGAEQTVLSGYGSSDSGSTLGSQLTQLGADTGGRGSFRIRGGVGGLYPGLSRPLSLTVTNPYTFAIVVTSITTTVIGVSAACPSSDLSVGAFAGHLAVPANGSATTAVHAGIAKSAPDACIGATFRLVYSGAGRKR